MKFFSQQIVFVSVACLSTFASIYFASNWNFLSHSFDAVRLFQTLTSIVFNYALIILFVALFRRFLTALLLSQIVVILVGFINHQKEKYLSTNFSPDDVLLFSEALKAAPWSLKVFFFAGVATFLAVLLLCLRKEKAMSWKAYSFHIAASIFFITSGIYFNYIKSPMGKCSQPSAPFICQQLVGFPNTRNDWIGDFRKIQNYGFTTFFMSKILDNVNEIFLPHEEVSRETIEKIFPQATRATPSLPIDSKQPNIVIVMDESWWDPRLLDKKLPKNLMPFMQRNRVSSMLSPSFGGGTANVEFEALTSLNTLFFRNELIYVSKLRKPIYSLPLYLNSLGYSTVAMHNNWRYYYNRNRVYKFMGFDKFISLENMLDQNNRATAFNQAGWANDDLIFKSIQDELQQQSDQPKFLYAITVENHPMYGDDRYGKQSFNLKNNLSDTAKQKLSTYSAGVARSDQKIAELAKFIQTLDKPTILIVFGDHLPNLQNVYDEYHYFDQDPQREQARNYETPLVLWSNFAINRRYLAGQYVPASFLAPKILQTAGLPLSGYYQFIDRLSQCYQAIHQKFVEEKQPACGFNKTQLLEDYKSLNNDTLNDHNYSYQLLKPEQRTE
ncbi:MAG: LTA synthase family protein [Acinetobacter sp.]